MRFDRPVDAQAGITVVRVAMGVILVVAGLAKWFGGIGGVIGFFGQLGIPLPQIMGPLVAAGEVVGGLLLVLGFRSRAVGVWFVCEFLVTALYVKLARGAGWDAARIDLMLLAGSLMVIVGGAGRFAIDEWMAVRGDRLAAPGEQAPLVSSHR